QEPLVIFLNFCVTLGAMLLMALTLRSGLWLRFGLIDMIAQTFEMGINMLIGGSNLLASLKQAETAVEGAPKWKPWAVVRGILLAFPLVFVLAMLLASADPIFSKMLNEILNLEQWVEYALRGVYIIILAYLLMGIYVYIVQHSNKDKLIGVEKTWPAPFLGFTEAAIILGAVDVLFAVFVGVQFRYFFGGQANIHLDGFTYAEYARRGFGELVAVAVLSLLLFQGLSTITNRTQVNTRRIFSGMGISLVVLVSIILVSAFQRLLLYESVYGFSRMRTYPHVFMIWLGLLLLATIVLEVIQRQRLFALTTLFAVVGFAATLNLMNVDDYIVRRNVTQMAQGTTLDVSYLSGLSDDAVPALFESYFTVKETAVKDALGANLACRYAVSQTRPVMDWQSFNWSKVQARTLFEAHSGELAAYPVSKPADGFWQVKVHGVAQDCLW
ncbi:MAG: DUF4173 domain-containing protein, partial [Anaerolineae bacterium]|nr:DUF4173 domain-containing protein [Anaerolineae bacterium]